MEDWYTAYSAMNTAFNALMGAYMARQSNNTKENRAFVVKCAKAVKNSVLRFQAALDVNHRPKSKDEYKRLLRFEWESQNIENLADIWMESCEREGA